MRVELTTSRVGPVSSDSVGDVLDIPIDEARRLILSGQAIAVGEQGVIETTMLAPDEAAARRSSNRKTNRNA